MKPILFSWKFQPHFSHFDLYGHINTKNIVEYVIESRHAYFHNRWGVSAKRFIENGYSVQTARMSFNFRKGVTEFSKITIESYVEKSIGPIIKVPFKGVDDSGIVYFDGLLEQVFVNLKTQSAMDSMPEDARQYFYE